MKSAVVVMVAVAMLLSAMSVEAVTAQLGDQDILVSGSFHVSGDFTSTSAGDPANFNTPCGSDGAANCNTSWTLSYASIPSTQTITGATLTLGIWDTDSLVAGDQVALYSINGTNVTTQLNTQFNAFGGADGLRCTGPNGPNTVFCSEYDVYTITVPGAALSGLAGGSAAIVLTLQGPGHGVLGNTTFNGAIIDFSQLDITTAPATTTPEPATLVVLAAGVGGLLARGLRRRSSRA